MRRLLQRLEELRHTDPKEAELRALAALSGAGFEDAARLLGIIGSSKRSQEQHDSAFRAITLGISIAKKFRAIDVLANLLQRLSYVVADAGRHLDAIEITEFALQLFATCGDIHGIGTTLVDQGIWLDGIGRTHEAIGAQENALELLDSAALKSIFSANQGLAHLYLKTKNLRKAEFYACRAIELQKSVGPTNQGKLAWVTGRIALAQGDRAVGRKYMEEAIDCFLDTSTVDSALVGIELVQILLESGDSQAAVVVAGSLRRLIGPLGQNRVAASAIAELSNLELAGAELTVVRLKELQQRIRATRVPTRAQGARIATLKPMVERN